MNHKRKTNPAPYGIPERKMRNWILVVALAFLLPGVVACKQDKTEAAEKKEGSIGVLIVSHGSHSPRWREMLENLGDATSPELLKIPGVSQVKSAFMEYTEPSIATRMKEFDEQNIKDVIVVPIFLTVSSHYLEDIPTILGMKSNPRSLERLKKEKIETYRPMARVTITPPMDFTSFLKKNTLRRLEEINPSYEKTGVVLAAYGDEAFNQQWEELMGDIGRHLKQKKGIDTVAFSWVGHIVRYSPAPTRNAVNQILKTKQHVAVIPLLVAVDPGFQGKIIKGAIDESSDPDRVLYRGDAILPDPDLNQWIVDITGETVKNI